MKCEICNREIRDNSQFINGCYYHNSCIEQLTVAYKLEQKIVAHLEQTLDEIENYLKGAYEMAIYSKSFMLDKDNVDELLDIINKAKGNDE